MKIGINISDINLSLNGNPDEIILPEKVSSRTKLFESSAKYESGSGWPSFFRSLPNVFETKIDYYMGYPRTESHCKK